MNTSDAKQVEKVLIAIPAYNEEETIRNVVERVRSSLPEFDLLIVNDGSRDKTEVILKDLGVRRATHLCNLSYGRAIQTILKYALKNGYDALVTLDADGQHHPEQVRAVIEHFKSSDSDLVIGSRYVKTHKYKNVPLGRRMGMQVFSNLVGLVGPKRIYDTTSGLKVIRRRIFADLASCHFVDFHAEAIVYLMGLGYRIDEHPITISERSAGESMYSFFSHFKYPLKTLLLVLVALVNAKLKGRG